MRFGLFVGAVSAFMAGPLTYTANQALADPPPTAAVAVSATDLATHLAAVEKSIDASRQDLHIPGASLVIVKDDRIIYIKGFGLRDIANKLPVTPDTQFAIGSSTKAFTAMTVMMSVDDGKLALTDSPRKFLPYFKLRDPEADSKITISDLLCHRSGLGRTDIAWYTNKLSSEETIRLIGTVKPTAKFGEKFQYQNVMFLVAGQCVGAVQHAPWRAVVARRIFQPLGMRATNTSIRDMLRSKDHSLGYTYDAEKKEPVLLPYHDLPAIAPAGAINSNAREMSKWLRLMLGGGSFEGRRLVSEASFAELFKKRIAMGGQADYGYGWMLHDWNGHRVAEHGGNIDGFNAQVALMPDQKLGFVLLTNVSASPLGSLAMETIWKELVGGSTNPADSATPAVSAKVAPEMEAGTYRLADVNVDMVIANKDGKLTLRTTGLPETPLENVNGRRYKVMVPNVDGVFATFRPMKDNPKETELLFEQPGGKFIGRHVADPKAAVVAFVSPFSSDEIMQKVVDAQGGEANLRRHKTATLKISIAIETQGLNIDGTVYSRAPNAKASVERLYAGRKQIGLLRSYFDGKAGGGDSSFSAASDIHGDELIDLATDSAFFPELNWKSLFKTVAITGQEKVGEEDVYVVEMKPEKGHPITDYVSTKTFRILRRKSSSNDRVESYDDFRAIDGVLIPFRRTGLVPGLGEAATTVTAAKFDAKIPDSVFHGPKPPDLAENP